jgi:hypothetical protein
VFAPLYFETRYVKIVMSPNSTWSGAKVGHYSTPTNHHAMNAYEIMASFNRQARKAGWPKDEIDRVLCDARSQDYEHLTEVIFQALDEIETSRATGLAMPSSWN